MLYLDAAWLQRELRQFGTPGLASGEPGFAATLVDDAPLIAAVANAFATLRGPGTRLQRDAALDELVDHRAFRSVGAHSRHASQQQRVVRDDQVAVLIHGLLELQGDLVGKISLVPEVATPFQVESQGESQRTGGVAVDVEEARCGYVNLAKTQRSDAQGYHHED